MKIRHLNPRQMVSIPEQCVTVCHPVLKAPPGEMRHTAELVNRPRQTSHHGKSLCTCSRRSASLSQGRPPGWLWTSATISPCISACSQSSGAIRKYASGSPEIFTQGKYLSPPACLPRSRTTPLAHIAGRAPESLILSLSWDYCESLLMERKPPKLPTLLRNLQPLRHLLHLSFVISDVGWSYSSATAGP